VTDGSGRPGNFGWARRPGLLVPPGDAPLSPRKVSASDRYVVFNRTHTVVFEVRDDGLLGHMCVSVAFRRDGKRSTKTVRTLLPLGAYRLPADSEGEPLRYRRAGTTLDFVPREGGIRILRAEIPRFGSSGSLRGELVLGPPEAGSGTESLFCNQGWPGNPAAFRFLRCSPWYSVEGVVQLGHTELVFAKGGSWGVFDWRRGVRPRFDLGRWACAAGSSGSRQIGLCVGHGGGDSSAGTENAFFVDARLHKLERVTFSIPSGGSPSPWQISGDDGRLRMTFAPRQERRERQSFLYHSLSRRQFFGTFSGSVVLDDGTSLDFDQLSGFAERSKLRF